MIKDHYAAALKGREYWLQLKENYHFKNQDGLILCAVQMIFLAAPVIPTEMALKKNFDKNGRRR